MANDGRLVHAGHTVLAVAEQTDATYWPLMQTVQLEPAVTPWRQNWLAAQAVLVDGLGQKKPEGQGVCAVEPAAQKLGEVQVALEEGLVQKEPKGHGLSKTVPVGHQLPELHATWDDGVVQTEPARQSVWVMDPTAQ